MNVQIRETGSELEDADGARAAWLRALQASADIERDPAAILPVRLLRLAERFPDAPALVSQNGTLTYLQLAGRIAHYARWTREQDLGPGDVVAMMMPTHLDYLPMWLGIGQAGAAAALLNPNARGAALAHAVGAVSPRAFIVHDSLAPAFDEARHLIQAKAPVWTHGPEQGGRLRVDLGVAQAEPDRALQARATIADRALYIFTSGTTGLPKAAIVSHRRALAWSYWFAGLMGTSPADRMYDCLPLHHSVGGVAAAGSALVSGASVYLRERFSAREFWSDVARHECTLFQYIGELCRYLLAAPPSPDERRHRLRLCCGNGLRPDIWEKFQARFAIPRILEFYASTEGNLSLYNVEGRVGSIGRLPRFSPRRNAVALVKVDDEGAPLRGPDRLCLPCRDGEAGEALAAIAGGSAGPGAFEGYSDPAETEKKILRDVLRPGDSWFRTGDLMRRDREGFYYFVDRMGDTFRWKGENVATLEVAEAFASFPSIREAVVYGVSAPGQDGRAGMALLVSDQAPDLEALRRHLESRLPSYARPLFLRLRSGVELTETFKYRKAPLQREGFDPEAVSDPLFYFDASTSCYEPLDRRAYARILSGDIRL